MILRAMCRLTLRKTSLLIMAQSNSGVEAHFGLTIAQVPTIARGLPRLNNAGRAGMAE
ncbi:hypothetical protein [Blastomonas sp.]|uniref:hypothetical protein n=1 Tax=Blastomonas sp. TaxID=1909299 RepID=UPI00258BF506|nr:hypothetical protein [Blastomonas sp.]